MECVNKKYYTIGLIKRLPAADNELCKKPSFFMLFSYKRSKVFIVVLCLALLSFSCSKDPNPEVNELIIGNWEWIETFNAWTGIKYTPVSEGYTQSSIYKDDNTVEYYKNGDLVKIESFRTKEIVYDPQDPNSETATILIVNETERYFSISNDTLTISQAHVDGPVTIHKRIIR